MKQEEKNILLAKADGWRLRWQNRGGGDLFDEKPDGHAWQVWTPPQKWWDTLAGKTAIRTGDFSICAPPNYFEDLNAVHELEELVWIDRYRYDYNNNLDRVVGATPVKGHESKVGPWFYEGTKARRATAAERAEAIGKTLKLW
jgi:hypothetical protein